MPQLESGELPGGKECECSPEREEYDCLDGQELPHWIERLQQVLCPLVEVDERVHGDADRDEVESSEIDVGAVWSEVAFVIYPTQLSDSIRERKNRRESEL